MNETPARLIFVYNADSGLLNAMKDAVWKILHPASYPCSLCALTYGWIAMHRRWRQFLGPLPQTREFYHRDDFARAFPGYSIALPAIVLAEDEADPLVLVSAPELDALPDLEALMALVSSRLAAAARS